MESRRLASMGQVDHGVSPVPEALEPVAWQSTSGGSFVSAEARRNVPIYREVYTVPLVTIAQAAALMAAERERWQSVVAHAASELAELDDETAQAQAAALRELCGPNVRAKPPMTAAQEHEDESD